MLSNYVGMIFLVNLTKDMRKHMEVVKLCWNDFHSKANDKNVIYIGDGSIFFGMNFLVNLTKQARKPRSYASSKLSPTYSRTGVRCKANSVAKKSLSTTVFSKEDKEVRDLLCYIKRKYILSWRGYEGN